MLKIFTGPYALLAKIGTGILVAGLLIWAVLAWLDSYGDRRYGEGVAATDQKWEDAAEEFRAQAAASATQADDIAADRLAEHVGQVAAEQEQIDEAMANGSSPFDVLFGASSGELPEN